MHTMFQVCGVVHLLTSETLTLGSVKSDAA